MHKPADNEHYLPKRYFEIDNAFIAAHNWPATLIDLALNRGAEEHTLLRGTGIFYADLLTGKQLLSPAQCLRLIDNIQHKVTSKDLSFLLGQRLYAGNQQMANSALIHARDLREALDILCQFQVQLAPLLSPKISYQDEKIIIYWLPNCSALQPAQEIFLVEMMSSALNSLCRWLQGKQLPWTFYFRHTQPNYPEQYQVHLKSTTNFNCQHHAMAIAREHLHSIWQLHSPSTLARARLCAEQELIQLDFTQGFVREVYEYLARNINHNPNLERTACDFAMSTASFKRKLQKHGTNFQAQYDDVRRDLALQWLHAPDITNEQIATRLHFHDAANLRRAFKKWTGLTPSATRNEFLLGQK